MNNSINNIIIINIIIRLIIVLVIVSLDPNRGLLELLLDRLRILAE